MGGPGFVWESQQIAMATQTANLYDSWDSEGFQTADNSLLNSFRNNFDANRDIFFCLKAIYM